MRASRLYPLAEQFVLPASSTDWIHELKNKQKFYDIFSLFLPKLMYFGYQFVVTLFLYSVIQIL